MELSGDMTDSTVTTGGGNYSFTVPDGSYTVTPTSADYVFTPTYTDVTVSWADEPNHDFTAEALVEVIVDNADPEAAYVGRWLTSTGQPENLYGPDSRYKAAGSGSAYVTWTPDLPTTGLYKVYARWPAHSNRASNAPYTINYAGGGSEEISVNQEVNGGQWNQLGTGTYLFEAGTSGSVVLSDDANQYVFADAIKWQLAD